MLVWTSLARHPLNIEDAYLFEISDVSFKILKTNNGEDSEQHRPKKPYQIIRGKNPPALCYLIGENPIPRCASTTTTSSALTSCPALFPRSFFKHCLHNLKQLIHMHHQLFVYILPNHPCSGSYGGKTAQVWNLWRYVQTFDCFEKAQPSCSLKNQGSLLTLWKPVYRQEILAQTSADSSSRSLVSTSSRGFCGQKIIMGPALSHKK